jgi:hypothetical protein
MDQEPLVEKQLEDGQRLIEQLAQEGLEVTTAFWLRTSDDSRWYFYVVSPIVAEEGIARAYRRLHPVFRRVSRPFGIDPMQVKAIGTDDPLAAEILAIHRRHPGRGPMRYGGMRLGGTTIEGAYLYPLAAPATR